jgi:serine/threonine-protein kinase HipA
MKRILVYADWFKGKPPIAMGTLSAAPSRGQEVFFFQYSEEWLKSDFCGILDPDLQFFTGSQYLQDTNKNNFGLFLDSSPDRWGRLLMRRKEAVAARLENRAERRLQESDYLLGVYDSQRMGGLRFKQDAGEPFLNYDSQLSVPPWSSLRELEYASMQIEKGEALNDTEYLKWLTMLISPGSSLGGARPKAGVIDTDNNLWIAKFPSCNDKKDTGAWEIVVNNLAKDAGLKTAEGMIRKFSGRHHTFLTRRFDRDCNGKRIHFASAMTMLGYTDGDNADTGASYLDIVEFILQHGCRADKDLEELWRRIIFYIAVSNTDDHLRNHGFLLTDEGWTLSPAFDINPVEYGTGLSLNISENDNSLDFSLARSVAGYFRISGKKAEEIISQVIESVSHWREYADKYNIHVSEQNIMAKAFRVK